MVNRLTWDPHGPAPFESAWSVFLKVLSTNRMTTQELIDLIQKDNLSRNSGRKKYDHFSDEWVDFDRYAQVLNVNADRLKQGFLNQRSEEHTSELQSLMRN